MAKKATESLGQKTGRCSRLSCRARRYDAHACLPFLVANVALHLSLLLPWSFLPHFLPSLWQRLTCLLSTRCTTMEPGPRNSSGISVEECMGIRCQLLHAEFFQNLHQERAVS